MDTYALVRPEHLNHFGYLFGGQLLKWVDENAWMAASRDFPGYHLVTRAMANIEFRERVVNGAILRFSIAPSRLGNTSVSYHVDIFADEPGAATEKWVFSTEVTFACVDETGAKRSLPRRNDLFLPG